MRIITVLAALFLAVTAFAPASKAATITDDVTFSATGAQFHSLFGGSSPLSSVSGSFRITFDPTQSYSNDTSVISNFTISLPGHSAGETVSYNYTPSFLIFGPSGTITGSGFNIGFTLAGLVSEITFSALKNGHTRYWTAFLPTTTITQVVAPTPTPVPPSLLLLLTGLLSLGGVGLMRNRHAATAAVPVAA
jgi:hypothetical protein